MKELEFIKEIVLDTGKFLKHKYDSLKKHRINFKNARDLITETDIAVEDELICKIKDKYPDDGILAEEKAGTPEKKKRMWIIDPIDGTTNFVHRIPFFAISIGLMEDEDMIAGAVYNPVQEELYSAAVEEGAFLNGNKITVSSNSKLIGSVVATGFACIRAGLKYNNLKNFCDVAVKVRGIRRFGAASIDLCFVARGIIDGFWEMNLNIWDVAAGSLIVREAGGKVTHFYNDKDFINGDRIIATNGILHEKLRKILVSNEPE